MVRIGGVGGGVVGGGLGGGVGASGLLRDDRVRRRVVVGAAARSAAFAFPQVGNPVGVPVHERVVHRRVEAVSQLITLRQAGKVGVSDRGVGASSVLGRVIRAIPVCVDDLRITAEGQLLSIGQSISVRISRTVVTETAEVTHFPS